MKHVQITEAREKLFIPNPAEFPDAGYLLFRSDENDYWTWLYQEPGEDDEFGPLLATRAEALANIAENWEDTGSGSPRFAGMMRGLAVRAGRTSPDSRLPEETK